MKRSFEREILDGENVPEETVNRAYAHITLVHKALGNVRTLRRALERHSRPLGRVLDIGCGRGELLFEIQRRFGVEGVGVDLRGPEPIAPAIRIIRANAVWTRLPECDVAIAVCLIHHLGDDELVELIRNVGRSCERFLILDLVRSRLPLLLFRVFVAPFIDRVAALDGISSIRRAYTPRELDLLVRRALQGSAGTYRHSVKPLSMSQLVDISYA